MARRPPAKFAVIPAPRGTAHVRPSPRLATSVCTLRRRSRLLLPAVTVPSGGQAVLDRPLKR